MKKTRSLAMMIMVSGAVAFGETEFVDAEQLDKVFSNVEVEAGGGGDHMLGVEDWPELFAADLSNADFPEGIWTFEGGELTASEDKVIWTTNEYDNFILDLEFRNGVDANSGVLLYVTDTAKWVQNSVEVQITDDHGEKWAKADPKHKCGAIFGCLAPDVSMVKPAGEWNRMTITAKGPNIDVVLNGRHVTSMNMLDWKSVTDNPDGSKKPKWLSTPFNTHPTKGKVGLQGKHGGAQIWFRNLRIRNIK